MKPRIFIGSSVESLPIAEAIHEQLDHVAEITTWKDGIFKLSQYTIDSLVIALNNSDFGIFVFSPEDIVNIRGKEHLTVRDNVLFELGLCIGKLGRERSFIVQPRHTQDFHLPTDLLGITPADYDANRSDQNLLAAVAPACNKIKRTMSDLGIIYRTVEIQTPTHSETDLIQTVTHSEGDIKVLLLSWMKSKSSKERLEAIQFNMLDKELNLPNGSTKLFIKEIASDLNYETSYEGDTTVIFKRKPMNITPELLDKISWMR